MQKRKRRDKREVAGKRGKGTARKRGRKAREADREKERERDAPLQATGWR